LVFFLSSIHIHMCIDLKNKEQQPAKDIERFAKL